MYKIIERGARNSSNFRVYLQHNCVPISPFHDIPLFVNKLESVLNMLVEIPRWSNEKMEISLDEPLNPLKQDVVGSNLRYLPNCFPYHGIPWNYGTLPQTWEHPNELDEFTKLRGDGDPIDAIEIGQRVPRCGEVLQVRVLGALALVDRNKIDWKLIVLSVDDDLFRVIRDINDVYQYFPNVVDTAKEWFHMYKVVAGKPQNKFLFNGEIQGSEMAHKIITTAHNHWKNLINSINTSGISCHNVSNLSSPFVVSVAEAEDFLEAAPKLEEPHIRDSSIDYWHFIQRN